MIQEQNANYIAYRLLDREGENQRLLEL